MVERVFKQTLPAPMQPQDLARQRADYGFPPCNSDGTGSPPTLADSAVDRGRRESAQEVEMHFQSGDRVRCQLRLIHSRRAELADPTNGGQCVDRVYESSRAIASLRDEDLVISFDGDTIAGRIVEEYLKDAMSFHRLAATIRQRRKEQSERHERVERLREFLNQQADRLAQVAEEEHQEEEQRPRPRPRQNPEHLFETAMKQYERNADE